MLKSYGSNAQAGTQINWGMVLTGAVVGNPNDKSAMSFSSSQRRKRLPSWGSHAKLPSSHLYCICVTITRPQAGPMGDGRGVNCTQAWGEKGGPGAKREDVEISWDLQKQFEAPQKLCSPKRGPKELWTFPPKNSSQCFAEVGGIYRGINGMTFTCEPKVWLSVNKQFNAQNFQHSALLKGDQSFAHIKQWELFPTVHMEQGTFALQPEGKGCRSGQLGLFPPVLPTLQSFQRNVKMDGKMYTSDRTVLEKLLLQADPDNLPLQLQRVGCVG